MGIILKIVKNAKFVLNIFNEKGTANPTNFEDCQAGVCLWIHLHVHTMLI